MTDVERHRTDAGDDAPGDRGTGDEASDRTPNRKRMAILSVVILAVTGVLAYLFLTMRPGPERVAPEPVPPLVEVVEVAPRAERLVVRSQGTVGPLTETTLSAQVSGRVVSVSPDLREGAFFSRGQVLVTIDPSDYRLAVQNAEAAVEQARTRLERIEAEAEIARTELDLLAVGDEASPLARYEPQLAEARSGLESARASRERTRLDLGRTTIEAPYDGRVRSLQVDVGQTVAPGSPVAAVFGTEAAEVRLPVSKDDLAYLPERLGLGSDPAAEIGISLEGELGGERRQWPGRLVRASGEIDSRTRMLSLFARVDDPYRREPGATGPPLPMGLFVEATIPGRALEGVYVVPRSALSSEGNLHVVGPDDRLQIRSVDVVRSTEERLVVRSGLDPGDRVVVSRLDVATDGMKVRPVTPKEGGPESSGESEPPTPEPPRGSDRR